MQSRRISPAANIDTALTRAQTFIVALKRRKSSPRIVLSRNCRSAEWHRSVHPGV